MDRRSFFWLLGAGTSAAALSAFAQPAGKLRKIGILNALPREAPLPQVFLRGLRDLGYVEGKNIIVEYRSGPYSDFPALAGELVNLKVDVIYAVLEQAAFAASKATTTIPIVFAVIGDPVRSGLVESLARPGRAVDCAGDLVLRVGPA
jgi:putative ABC transport system substrate-binding protein